MEYNRQNTFNPQAAEVPKPGLKEWVHRQKSKLMIGAVATATVCSFTLEPIDKTAHAISEAGPWVGTGLAASEGAWQAGAALMLIAAGSKIKNPLKIHKQFEETWSRTKDSKIYKAGFGINLFGAVGLFGVSSAGILELPHSAWGLMVWPIYDFGLTAARVRLMTRSAKEPPSTANSRPQEFDGELKNNYHKSNVDS